MTFKPNPKFKDLPEKKTGTDWPGPTVEEQKLYLEEIRARADDDSDDPWYLASRKLKWKIEALDEAADRNCKDWKRVSALGEKGYPTIGWWRGTWISNRATRVEDQMIIELLEKAGR